MTTIEGGPKRANDNLESISDIPAPQIQIQSHTHTEEHPSIM